MSKAETATEDRRVDAPALAMLFTAIALAVTGQLLMKHGTTLAGADGGPSGLARALLSPYVLAGLGCFVISSLLWLVVLSRLDLSYAFPMIALAQVAVQLLSWLLLGERIPPLRIVGLTVICVGVICVGLSYSRRRPAPEAIETGGAPPSG